MNKQFAVLGLGSFGWSVALALEDMGCDVLAVDSSYERIQEISDEVSYAMRADVAEPEALGVLGDRSLDGVVVAISENLEAAIMAVMTCKEMGIPLVVAKALDPLQGRILKKVGADTVVYPEMEMGSRLAKNLAAQEFSDWIALSGDYSMVEIPLPESWAEKSLSELGIRENYEINVVGIIRNGEMSVALDPHEKLLAGSVLIVIGANEVLEKFNSKSFRKMRGKK